MVFDLKFKIIEVRAMGYDFDCVGLPVKEFASRENLTLSAVKEPSWLGMRPLIRW